MHYNNVPIKACSHQIFYTLVNSFKVARRGEITSIETVQDNVDKIIVNIVW